MKANVFNQTDYDIDLKYYKYFLSNALKVAGINGEVNLLFSNDNYIRELNKKPILWKGDKEKYRNICG